MGVIRAPRARFSFWEARSSWSRSEWIGAGRMAIDGLKEVQESVMRIEAGLSTYEKNSPLWARITRRYSASRSGNPKNGGQPDFRVRYGSLIPINNRSRRAVRRRRKSVQRNLSHIISQATSAPLLLEPAYARVFFARWAGSQALTACTFPVITKVWISRIWHWSQAILWRPESRRHVFIR